jgi:hypothetical protein
MAAATLASMGAITEDASSGGGSTAITMPSAISAGDLLIIVGGNYFGNSYGCSGWTQLADYSSYTDLFVYAKIAAGSDTATITTSFANHYLTVRAFRFTGHGCSTVSDIKVGTLTGSVDPASLDTGSTKDWHFLAACFAQSGAAETPPSGYSAQGNGNSGTSSLAYGWATKTATTQIEDPGAFGGSTSSATSIVLAIPPAAGAASLPVQQVRRLASVQRASLR